MKDFMINLGLWIILLVPIYSAMLALEFISKGNELGFTISSIITLVASIIIYRILHK